MGLIVVVLAAAAYKYVSNYQIRAIGRDKWYKVPKRLWWMVGNDSGAQQAN